MGPSTSRPAAGGIKIKIHKNDGADTTTPSPDIVISTTPPIPPPHAAVYNDPGDMGAALFDDIMNS